MPALHGERDALLHVKQWSPSWLQIGTRLGAVMHFYISLQEVLYLDTPDALLHFDVAPYLSFLSCFVVLVLNKDTALHFSHLSWPQCAVVPSPVFFAAGTIKEVTSPVCFAAGTIKEVTSQWYRPIKQR